MAIGRAEWQTARRLFIYSFVPFQGGFGVAAGLESAISFLENFRYQTEDLDYLATLRGASGDRLFDEDFLRYLDSMRFECDVLAVPEGSIVFPYEPLLRVTGPLIQAQLLETPLLNCVNFPTLIATKAARVCMAADGEEVLEFGLRRSQGIDGGLSAARAAFIGGCTATSNVLAGKLFDIPVRGTHAHSWVMAFETEGEAFQTYADAMPDNCVFLVDTYNSIEGVKRAIEVGRELRAKGKDMLGVRLDSGDLAYLSIQARELLDEAGFENTAIVASNELDEHIISDLKRQGACISVWGVGTQLVTGGSQCALDGVYKVSAIRWPGKDWEYRLKLSEQMTKVSNPGILQVRRYRSKDENVADVLYNEGTQLEGGCTVIDPFDPTRRKRLGPDLTHEDLLKPIFDKGSCVYKSPSLREIQERVKAELRHFHQGVKRFVHPHQYVVGLERSLYDLKIQLIERIRHHESPYSD